MASAARGVVTAWPKARRNATAKMISGVRPVRLEVSRVESSAAPQAAPSILRCARRAVVTGRSTKARSVTATTSAVATVQTRDAGETLACAPDCTFDTTDCLEVVCGDGVVGGDEQCDCGPMGDGCTAAQLANQSCTTRPSPAGGNYGGGTLACNSPESCTFDESGCYYCGDGAIDPGEQCDGADLGGATCQSQGFDAGSLSCTNTCTLNTSNCVTYVCGNGICDPGENECNCVQDCPNNPNSCAPCQCGGNAGSCWCDASCVNFGDCCFNGPC
jgi:hypothetical protein